ncbi:YhcH/YjgK/YiaL family protein [Aestuariibaculum sediminum]|uniref:YhcH/YjgK/YiaL family protein n=1 Tax=Aestuariibaculum sediminum TaxID=2770637 RepID=A0A8J6U782_9FLAO|nr:YhcH/YjgK/YiaL family protein [Aestuariibaculum sediminum]MBD0831598.1 YhcH/YjgK/YiaL family protein [Aestuariibaculum sediminum]
MILDKIENINMYTGTHKYLDKALKYISNTNFLGMEEGAYVVEGDRIYAIIKSCQTKRVFEKTQILEGHMKYIDIHFLIKGKEQVGIKLLSEQKQIKAYTSEGDYALYESLFDIFTLNEGMFVILFPDDIHLPEITSCKISDIKKVVVKVKI